MEEIYSVVCSQCDQQLNFWEKLDENGYAVIVVVPCTQCCEGEGSE